MNDSGSAALGVLIFVGLFAVCLVWEILKRKANTALNRNLFSRGTYQEQQALTEHRFTYPCRAKWSDVKPLLKESPLGDNLQVAKETDDGVQWIYYAFHLRTTGNGEFTAYLQIDEQAQRATFEFIRWANVDGVVRHIDEMKQLKTWVQDVIEQANRNQTAQSMTQPARPVPSPQSTQSSTQHVPQPTQPARPAQPATHAVPLPSQDPAVRIHLSVPTRTPATAKAPDATTDKTSNETSTGPAAPTVQPAAPTSADADQATPTTPESETDTASALAENHMKPTKPFTPQEWTIGEWHPLLPMFQQRWKYAAFVPPVIGLIGVLYFGFKPSGSYAGYTAGSIILPDRYTDYGTGSILEEYGYMSADQLNAILADLRGENMHGFIGWIVFTLVMLALVAVLSMAYDASSRSMATLLSNDDDMYRFFRDRYESKHGKYTPSFQDEALNLPLTIADYSYEWLLRPGMLGANQDAPITENYKAAVYQQSRTFLGRLYLLYNDLWFDAGTTTAKRLFGAVGGTATSAATTAAPTWQTMTAQAQSQRSQGTTALPEKTPAASAASPASPMPVAASAPAPVYASASAPMHTSAPVSAAAPDNATSSTSGSTTPFTPRSQMPPVPLPQPAAAPVPGSYTSREFKFCGQCGAKLKREMAFCTQCGAKCVR
ncbi:zinc ribbon domain-containing protein [Bifidobacterium parmae]|uniref:Antifreeze glycoprotein H1C1A1 n=1 Tax=Bifidobacterium parmae TaxID=361854 RepID=A0A2N5IVV0_9BIFI|nr:zinc ribbon domain-containing protein [Bifidobacterium parmae]PLS26081.1 antifreeze glycoprotein H1C1A1 [Bifidobacterium parmae]